MILRKTVWLLCACLLLASQATAQILDDSTKQVYGPFSTRYRLERDLFNGTDTLYTIDTTYNAYHDYLFEYQNGRLYHNLGEMGTAMEPLYYELPETPGVDLGMHAFDGYAFQPSDVRYFDTRSPFSSLYYVQGTAGQQMLITTLSRNITPTWNVGLRWRRMSSDKQLDANNRDKRSDDHGLVIQSSYHTPDNRYWALVSFLHLNHQVSESGGILPDPGDTQDSLFDYEQERVRLSATASNRDKRNQWHLYQQFNLDPQKGVQLFHILDQKRHWDRYIDDEVNREVTLINGEVFRTATDFYPHVYLSATSTQHKVDFAALENTLGTKGRLLGFQYSFYYFRRDLWYDQPYADLLTPKNEGYGGATLKYFLNDSNYVETEGLYQLAGAYRFAGRFNTNWLNVEYVRQRSAPPLLAQSYVGNHFIWNNEFDYVRGDRLRGQAQLRLRRFAFRPYADIHTLNNYIYYGTDAQPAQTPDRLLTFSAGVQTEVRFGRFAEELHARVTQVTGPDVLRMPPWYFHNRFYYQNNLFQNALSLQVGFDVRMKGSYYANAYMPVTQQFYLQNDFLVESYPIVDLFMNARIKRVNLFLKLSQINQGYPANGYFMTPYYPGMQRSFVFGVHWQFFD
ncbi:putative porin [Catalinimonas alkaloidigena]|uniref:putative porin n=1 Tax=Catalinimonas alkaloidigena TaxID=1075417 RepID=UPI0015A4CCC0|nr:putative porin [Catalinimonas alkaloidigena]